ncbi:DUF2254 domain-containing protein [Alkalibacterium olivapovliticus]|uniref:Putative membrane protein n=1 Tax=Alkalibacterium olivapovliticus TaxID=99907 RepID=A0A2T0W955_9LACT|nr:DUF2254 domain-containing protein [Alkalibacterium olivapovliticus]PRY83223.1 putative membrane protein [Alkalibacterium olivapovliticus]
MIEQWNLNIEETKIWVTLGGSVLFSFLLAVFVISLDTRVIPVLDQFPTWTLTSVNLAREILSLLAGSLFSVATFTFATMLTIITLYTSNFSPRAIENFLLNKTSMQTLGIFLGGFIYCLSSLFFMRSSEDEFLVISATVALFYAFGSVIMFTRFVYSSSQFVQLEKLIHNLYSDANKVYDDYVKRFEAYKTVKHLPEVEFLYTYTINAVQSAYIEHIDFEELKKGAQKTEALIKVYIRVGHFVAEEEPVAEIKTNQKQEDLDQLTESVNRSLSYEEQKSTLYDPDYARSKLTEVALRAVSPGINDPNTAIHILHYKALLEKRLASLPGKYVIIKQSDEPLEQEETSEKYEGTVFYRYNDFSEGLYRGYWQLVFYMQKDISGVHALFESVKTIAYTAHYD